jgi:hypothetical protein
LTEEHGTKTKAIENAGEQPKTPSKNQTDLSFGLEPRQTKIQECNSDIGPRQSCPKKENRRIKDCINKTVNTECVNTLETWLWYLHRKTWGLAERQRNMVDSDSDSFDDVISQEAALMVNKQGQPRLP